MSISIFILKVPQGEHAEEKQEDKSENVIVQSSAGERKSYSKERRVRTVGKTRVQDSALNAVQEGIGQMQLETDGQTDDVKPSGNKERGKEISRTVNTCSWRIFEVGVPLEKTIHCLIHEYMLKELGELVVQFLL